LLGLLPGKAWEMAPPTKVAILQKNFNSVEARAVGFALGIRLAEYLQRLCVSTIRTEDLSGILGWGKYQELAGTNDGQWAIEAATESLGAQYVIWISASEDNGEISFSASMKNGPSESRTIPSGPGELDAVDSLVEEFAGELSSWSDLDSGCEPHWSGVITFTLEQKNDSEKSGPVAGGGEGSHYAIRESSHMEEKTEAVLLTLPPGGGDTNPPMARLTYAYHEHDEVEFHKTQKVKCGPAGVGLPDPWRVVHGAYSDVTDDHGTTSSRKPVNIVSDSSTGEYTFDVGTLDLTTKRTETYIDANSNLSCTPEEEKSVVTKSEKYHAGGRVTAGGKVDPEHPKILSGQKVIGDLENGRYTWTWNLRLVEPKSKK